MTTITQLTDTTINIVDDVDGTNSNFLSRFDVSTSGELVIITSQYYDYHKSVHFSELSINGTIAANAQDAFELLAVFIGNFKTGGGTPVPTPTQHNGLLGRDAINCHPISAITDLQSTLNNKLNEAPNNGTAYSRKSATWVDPTQPITQNTVFQSNQAGPIVEIRDNRISQILNNSSCTIQLMVRNNGTGEMFNGHFDFMIVFFNGTYGNNFEVDTPYSPVLIDFYVDQNENVIRLSCNDPQFVLEGQQQIVAKTGNYDNSYLTYTTGQQLIDKALINQYSYNRRIVGKWVDGRNIYQKVIYVTGLPNTGTKAVPHTITNLDSLWIVKASAKNPTSGGGRGIPTASTTQLTNQIGYNWDNTNINLVTAMDLTSFSRVYLVLEWIENS